MAIVNHLSDINIYTTGGTIMKTYDPSTGSVVNCGWDASRLYNFLTGKARVYNGPIYITSLFSKDSNDIIDDDFDKLNSTLVRSDKRVNIVLMGTDRMSHIAKRIGEISGKVIIFIGSIIPMDIPNSDAEFNLGYALGCANFLDAGTYIAMNGQVFNYDDVYKNKLHAAFDSEVEPTL